MSINLKSSRQIGLALLLGIALAGCASGPPAPTPEIAQQIQAARTKADHQELAAYYGRQAVAARAIASQHRKMEQSYPAAAITGPRGGVSMASHCSNIIRSQEAIALEYEALAEGHQQMAKQAQP